MSRTPSGEGHGKRGSTSIRDLKKKGISSLKKKSSRINIIPKKRVGPLNHLSLNPEKNGVDRLSYLGSFTPSEN